MSHHIKQFFWKAWFEQSEEINLKKEKCKIGKNVTIYYCKCLSCGEQTEKCPLPMKVGGRLSGFELLRNWVGGRGLNWPIGDLACTRYIRPTWRGVSSLFVLSVHHELRPCSEHSSLRWGAGPLCLWYIERASYLCNSWTKSVYSSYHISSIPYNVAHSQ